MKRFGIVFSVAFSLLLFTWNAHSFVDPSSGIKIDELGSAWTMKFGFGRDIAKYRSEGGIELIVRWVEAGGSALPSSILNEYGNAKILSREGEKGTSITFKTDDRFGMAVTKDVLAGSARIEFLCSSPDIKRLEGMLACRRVASSLDTIDSGGRISIEKVEIPDPDSLRGMRNLYDANPSNVGLALKLVLSRYLFAIFDGRYGCEPIFEELLRMSNRLQKNNEDGLAHDLLALTEVKSDKTYPRFEEISWFAGKSVKGLLGAIEMERSGRIRSAKSIYKKLIRKNYRFFAGLRLVKLDLEDGNYEEANDRLSEFFDDEKIASNLLGALRVWVVRLSGSDISEAKLRSVEDFCGESGSIHAKQLGLLTINSDSKKSIQYFTQAIEADPSYIPTYILLGRALIEGGGGTRSSLGELKRLLDRAPKTSAVKRLSLRLNAWSKKFATFP